MKYRIKAWSIMDLRLLTVAAVAFIASIDSGDILALLSEFSQII